MLYQQPTSYSIKIARFLPKVEVVDKHGVSARRLFIRGHNGVVHKLYLNYCHDCLIEFVVKSYPYLVVGDNSLIESRREERVLQLCRSLNVYMGKRKVIVLICI